jgi:superfamily II DNA or RNA helicase
MSILDVRIARHYNSDECDVLTEFYQPLLRHAIRYDRAVGYFSSSALRACARELGGFLNRDGRIRLVVGCLVSKADAQALSPDSLSQEEQELIREQLRKELNDLKVMDMPAAILFSQLVASGVIELKFAVRSAGIYHEKFGVFTDADANKVAFIGSTNETESALAAGKNHESFSVFQSVDAAIYEAYGQPLEMRFANLWDGRTKQTRIYSLDDRSLAMMREIAGSEASPERRPAAALPGLASRYSLRPYQNEALQAWKAHQYRGILAMATGTGKTLTAVDAVKRFRGAVPGGAVVITVPYQNLALQWIDALREQGIDTLGVFDSYTRWHSQVKNYFLASQDARIASMPCFVCVNDTFRDGRFQELTSLLGTAKQRHHLLIADECHHFNSPEQLKKLPGQFTFRLGLSATPYDQFAQHYLDEYFGGIVFEFPLRRAIEDGFLTPYRYHILETSLDDEETEQYEELTHRIIKVAGSDESFTPETLAKVQHLLLARARIVGAARGKLEQLEAHLFEEGRHPFTLFYCGDGSLEDDGERQRQIELVSQLLHRLGWRSSRITAEESLKERESLLDGLRRKTIDAVVSIKVLDEGIDVPVCRRAYLLASQSSDRQGVQRRGRVLRKAEGKDVADLYDFVVSGGASGSKSMGNLARKELRRAWAFSGDAVNAQSSRAYLQSLAARLGLDVEKLNEKI